METVAVSESVGSRESAARERARQALSKLPPFSPILNRLIASLADEDISFAELAGLIEKDTVLAGNVLRLVNSALYGWRGTVNSVRHAVSLIGLVKLRNTAISMSITQLWGKAMVAKGWSQAQFNLHATATAILADLLATQMETEYAEGAFTAGLLSDLGVMVIATGMQEEFARIRQAYQSGGGSLSECERSVLGIDHAELTAEALQAWNLPVPIQHAARRHHGPHDQPESGVALSSVIEMADTLAAQQGIQLQPWLSPVPGDAAGTLAALGLPDRVLQDFQAELDATRVFFR